MGQEPSIIDFQEKFKREVVLGRFGVVNLFAISMALAWFGGTMLGFAAIGVALLKFEIPARKFGWACLLAGAYSMGGMTLANKLQTPIPFQPNLIVYLLATAPLWLGLFTLLACHAYHGQQPSEDGKFPLIFLFYVIALAAMFFGLCVLMDQLTISETSSNIFCDSIPFR